MQYWEIALTSVSVYSIRSKLAFIIVTLPLIVILSSKIVKSGSENFSIQNIISLKVVNTSYYLYESAQQKKKKKKKVSKDQ